MQVGMAMKNSIEIIISATDRASSALQKSSRSLKDWATKNEIPLQRLKMVGQETFSILSNKVLEFTDKASKTKEAEDAMGRLAKNINLNSKDILSWLKNASVPMLLYWGFL